MVNDGMLMMVTDGKWEMIVNVCCFFVLCMLMMVTANVWGI